MNSIAKLSFFLDTIQHSQTPPEAIEGASVALNELTLHHKADIVKLMKEALALVEYEEAWNLYPCEKRTPTCIEQDEPLYIKCYACRLKNAVEPFRKPVE